MDDSQSEASQRAEAGVEPKPQAAVNLMYFGFAKVSVRGPISGELYEFSRHEPVRPVDARDAVSMLKTRLFRRIR